MARGRGSLFALVAAVSFDASGIETHDQRLTITITDGRLASPALDIPAAVDTVDRERIQGSNQQLGLDEALLPIPGLFMQNRYNFAQDLRISIRGFGARTGFGIRGVKILMDDFPESLPDGQAQVDSIDMGTIGSLEVIRGAVSALYGNASGGVINISTEQPGGDPFIEPGWTMGESGFRKARLKFGGGSEASSYLVNLSSMRLDGFREHSRVESRQAYGKWNVRIDGRRSLSAIMNLTDSPIADDPGALTLEQTAADPTQANSANILYDAGESVEQQRVGWIYRHRLAADRQLTVRNYYTWRDFSNRLPFNAGGIVAFERFHSGIGIQYEHDNRGASQGYRAVLGLDVDVQDDHRKRFNNEFGSFGELTLEQREEVLGSGLFVQTEWALSDPWLLSAGLRYDRLRFRATDSFLSDGDDSGTRTLEEISSAIGIVYRLTPDSSLYANIGTSFETPTTNEFANPDGAGFNPALEAQRATNYEIGLKRIASRGISYALSLFHIAVRDELVPFELSDMPGRTFYENAGRSNRDGLELSVSTPLSKAVSLNASYTRSDFRFDNFTDSDGDNFDGNATPGIPRNHLHAMLSYDGANGVRASIEAEWVDSIPLDNANSQKSTRYTVVNARLGKRWRGSEWAFDAFLGINNIFDERYPQNVRINAFGGRYFEPAPGRNAYLGLTARLRFDG